MSSEEGPPRPPQRSLEYRPPSRDVARVADWVDWRHNIPYVDDKILILKEDDVQTILHKEFANVPVTLGYLRWYSLLRQKYLNLSRRHVVQFLANNEGHQRYKRPRNKIAGRAIVITKPAVVWACDIKKMTETYFRGRRMVGVIIFIDLHSKFVCAYPIKTTSVEETTRCVRLWVSDVRKVLDLDENEELPIRFLRSDSGTEFKGNFNETLDEFGIKHVFVSVASPTNNGSVERAAQTFGQYAMSTSQQKYGTQTRWPEVIGMCSELINSTWSRVLLGRPIDAIRGEDTDKVNDRLVQEGKKRKFSSLYDKHPLKVGDHVRISIRASGTAAEKNAIKARTRKVGSELQWSEAVFTVTRRISRERYKVSNGKVYDLSDLQRVPGPEAATKYPRATAEQQAKADEDYQDPRLQPLPRRQRVPNPRYRNGATEEEVDEEINRPAR